MSAAYSEYRVSTDPELLDLDWVHDRLSTDTYWATQRPKERVEQAIKSSRCYGVYTPQWRQVGFARLITDYTVFAWMGDVYIDRAERKKGLSIKLITHIMDDVKEWQLRRIVLSTADAADLYRRFGFEDLRKEDNDWLQVVWPDHV